MGGGHGGERTLLLQNSFVEELQKNKFGLRVYAVIVILVIVSAINYLNFGSTMICCFGSSGEFSAFWPSYFHHFFLVVFLAAYFLGRSLGALICNVFLNFSRLEYTVCTFLLISFFVNLTTLFNLLPLTFLKLRTNPYAVILIRFALGFAAGNSTAVRSTIFRLQKDYLSNISLVLSLLQFMAYAVTPILGDLVDSFLHWLRRIIPSLNTSFVKELFGTFTFINVVMALVTLVVMIIAFVVLRKSSVVLLGLQREAEEERRKERARVARRKKQRRRIEQRSDARTHPEAAEEEDTALLAADDEEEEDLDDESDGPEDEDEEQSGLKSFFHKIGGGKLVLVLMFLVQCWVFMHVLLVYDTLHVFVSARLTKIFHNYKTLASALLFASPTITIIAVYSVFFVLKAVLRRYRPNCVNLLSFRPQWWQRGQQQKRFNYYVAILVVFGAACLIYSVPVVAFAYFQNKNDATFLVVLLVYSCTSAILVPAALSIAQFFFVRSLISVFVRQTTAYYGYWTCLESIAGLISASLIISLGQESAFIVSFAFLIIGVGCFALTVYVFSTSEIPPGERVATGQADLEDGLVDPDENAGVAAISLPSVGSEGRLAHRFFLVRKNKHFRVMWDALSQRIVVDVEVPDNVRSSVYFHRVFQDKHILRVKAHVRNRKECYVLFEPPCQKCDEWCNLADYLRRCNPPRKKSRRRKSTSPVVPMTWNEKIDMATSIVSLAAELHCASYCHGYFSSWNVLLMLKERKIRKYKLLYVGRLVPGSAIPIPPPSGADTASSRIAFTMENDLRCLGALILELFEEKPIQDSSFRFLLQRNYNNVDIPFSAIRQCSEDEVDFPVDFRRQRWHRILALLKECFKKHPLITPEHLAEELQARCKLVENDDVSPDTFFNFAVSKEDSARVVEEEAVFSSRGLAINVSEHGAREVIVEVSGDDDFDRDSEEEGEEAVDRDRDRDRVAFPSPLREEDESALVEDAEAWVLRSEKLQARRRERTGRLSQSDPCADVRNALDAYRTVCRLYRTSSSARRRSAFLRLRDAYLKDKERVESGRAHSELE